MRVGHTYKYYVTAFGESVLLAERDTVQRVAQMHEAVDAPMNHFGKALIRIRGLGYQLCQRAGSTNRR
jgi:hypothetical protein